MNKKTDPSIYSEVIKKLLSAGINCSCYFIFGFPGETDETAIRTCEFIKNNEHPNLEGVLTWSVFPFLLVPLSPIYAPEKREAYNLTGYRQNWKHSTMNSQQVFKYIKTFFENAEVSSPIYRGDNLKLFYDLSPEQRKLFVAERHRMSKLSMKGGLKDHVLLTTFQNILNK